MVGPIPFDCLYSSRFYPGCFCGYRLIPSLVFTPAKKKRFSRVRIRTLENRFFSRYVRFSKDCQPNSARLIIPGRSSGFFPLPEGLPIQLSSNSGTQFPIALLLKKSVKVTAAGPLPMFTGFPIQPLLRHLKQFYFNKEIKVKDQAIFFLKP